MTTEERTTTPPTEAERMALHALRIGVQMGIQWMDRGSIVRVSADDACEQVGGWVESPVLDSRMRPLARRLVSAIRSEALHDAMARIGRHVGAECACQLCPGRARAVLDIADLARREESPHAH